MRGIRFRVAAWPLLIMIAAALAALAGCGGSSGGDPSSGDSSTPQPQEPIGQRIPAFERAAAGLDCDDALEVVHPALLPQPESGASEPNCDAAVDVVRSVRGFRATDSQDFGTAAVVDGAANGSVVSLIWALDDEGQLKWIGGTHSRPEVGTERQDSVEYNRGAKAFLEALRADDCEAAFKAIAPHARLAYGGRKEFCDKSEDTFTATAEGFGSRLKADPDAELVPLGATRDMAFYGVATKPAGYRTVITNGSREGERSTVYDVIPAQR